MRGVDHVIRSGNMDLWSSTNEQMVVIFYCILVIDRKVLIPHSYLDLILGYAMTFGSLPSDISTLPYIVLISSEIFMWLI